MMQMLGKIVDYLFLGDGAKLDRDRFGKGLGAQDSGPNLRHMQATALRYTDIWNILHAALPPSGTQIIDKGFPYELDFVSTRVFT